MKNSTAKTRQKVRSKQSWNSPSTWYYCFAELSTHSGFARCRRGPSGVVGRVLDRAAAASPFKILRCCSGISPPTSQPTSPLYNHHLHLHVPTNTAIMSAAVSSTDKDVDQYVQSILASMSPDFGRFWKFQLLDLMAVRRGRQ